MAYNKRNKKPAKKPAKKVPKKTAKARSTKETNGAKKLTMKG